MRVSIVNVQAPFQRGGAEYLADSLASRIRARGHEVDPVRLPFKWYPASAIIDHMLAYRLMNVGCEQADVTIALKFPAYLVPAANKRLWLLHQFRQAYELWGTEMAGWGDTPENAAIRAQIVQADNTYLPEVKAIYTNSHTVAGRLKRFNNIEATEVLFPPLDRPELFQPGRYDDYFFYPSRVTHAKRQHIAVEAMRYVRSPFRLVLAGKPDSKEYGRRLNDLIEHHNLSDKVTQLGWISEEEKAMWMQHATAAVYLPYDEDSYGYVTLEAFHCGKSVLSFTDSGGVSELVTHEENGLLTEPTPHALADAMERVWANKTRARELGAAAKATIPRKHIEWDYILDRLLG